MTASILVLTLAVFLLPAFTQAQDIGLNYANEIGLVDSGGRDLREVIVDVVKYLLTFVGIIALAVIMYGGFLWMTSGANPERLARAKKTIVNGAIGLVIIIFSYAIVVFIINLFEDGLGGGGDGGGGRDRFNRGIGALGACTVETVYPEPGQEDVPRNTAIIVTFREPVNPEDICQDTDGSPDCNGETIRRENIRIHKEGGDTCSFDSDSGLWTNCEAGNANALVTGTDGNKTWVIVPTEYLGSPSEIIDYEVYLSGAIRKPDGTGIFSTCLNIDFLSWVFTVSNRIDLTPPQVQSVFPPADSERDDSTYVPEQAASGTIRVLSAPDGLSPGRIIAGPANTAPGTIAAAVSGFNNRQTQSGTLAIAFTDEGRTARLENRTASLLLGSAASNADLNSVTFPGFFTLSLSDPAAQFAEGNEWTLEVAGYRPGDTLRVDPITYVFVAADPSGDQILVGATVNDTADNIAAKLSASHPDATAAVPGAPDTVRVTAQAAGTAGNGIILSVSDPAKFAIEPMSGGRPAGTILTPAGAPDQPRNAVIQVNFNEAVNPVTVSGAAADLWGVIAAKCVSGACSGPEIFDCGGEACVRGRWLVSNVYRTVEFVPDYQCGTNSCGEPIFCLPPDSNIRVDIRAAELETCALANCAARAPFTTCHSDDHCYNPDPAPGTFFPLSSGAMNGVMDAALNSLDGNRDSDADGPASYFDQNGPNPADGDSYQWSFWLSSQINADPPRILSIRQETDAGAFDVNQGATDVDLESPIQVNFDKVMMSSSLKTGSTLIDGPAGRVRHKNINLWNFANRATGFWIAAVNQDLSPVDGVPEWTRAEIRHSPLADSTSYRAQAGSAVKDIYQNCFNPSLGPDCPAVNATTPNCCSGTTIGPDGLNARTGNCQ